MKTVWLRKEGAKELLLLFNGWGMDGRIGDHLLEKSLSEKFTMDLLLCYDYRNLELDAIVMEEMSHYNRITLVAWSFGVWVAQQTTLPPIAEAIAINGTISPIEAEKGIRPDVFMATLSTWSEENRQRFNRRMCGTSEALELFTSMMPNRSVEDQQEELARLQKHVLVTGSTTAAWSYNHAIIGGRDLVFPAQQQSAAWQGVPQTLIADMPHFPFLHFKNLQEVLACLSR